MLFRNVRNGAVLDMPDSFSGKYWESVETPTPDHDQKPEDAAVAKKAAGKDSARKKPSKK